MKYKIEVDLKEVKIMKLRKLVTAVLVATTLAGVSVPQTANAAIYYEGEEDYSLEELVALNPKGGQYFSVKGNVVSAHYETIEEYYEYASESFNFKTNQQKVLPFAEFGNKLTIALDYATSLAKQYHKYEYNLYDDGSVEIVDAGDFISRVMNYRPGEKWVYYEDNVWKTGDIIYDGVYTEINTEYLPLGMLVGGLFGNTFTVEVEDPSIATFVVEKNEFDSDMFLYMKPLKVGTTSVKITCTRELGYLDWQPLVYEFEVEVTPTGWYELENVSKPQKKYAYTTDPTYPGAKFAYADYDGNEWYKYPVQSYTTYEYCYYSYDLDVDNKPDVIQQAVTGYPYAVYTVYGNSVQRLEGYPQLFELCDLVEAIELVESGKCSTFAEAAYEVANIPYGTLTKYGDPIVCEDFSFTSAIFAELLGLDTNGYNDVSKPLSPYNNHAWGVWNENGYRYECNNTIGWGMPE